MVCCCCARIMDLVGRGLGRRKEMRVDGEDEGYLCESDEIRKRFEMVHATNAPTQLLTQDSTSR